MCYTAYSNDTLKYGKIRELKSEQLILFQQIYFIDLG